MRSVLSVGLVLFTLFAAGALAAASDAKPMAASAGAEVMMGIPVTTPAAGAKAEFMQGMGAADAGRPEEASAHFAAAMKADPSFALAYLGAALAAPSVEAFAANLKHAAEHAAKASEAERAWIEAIEKSFANDGEGSLKASTRLSVLVPDSPRAWLQLGQAQADLGRTEEARVAYRKAIQVAPSFAPAHAALGNSYLFNAPKDFAKAEDAMGKVVALAPKEAQSHDFMGDVYRAENKLVEARDSYTRAAELEPTKAEEPQQRGHTNTFLGNWSEARADYDRAIALAKSNDRASYGVTRALVSVYEGKPQVAVEELKQLVAKIDTMDLPSRRSAKIDVLFNISLIAIHGGMFKEVQAALDQYQALTSEQAKEIGSAEFRRNQEVNVAYLRSMLAARQGDFATAAARAGEIGKLVAPVANPRKDEPMHEVMGYAALQQKKYAEAVEHYKKGNRDDVYVSYNLALAQEWAGNAAEAKRLFKEVAANNFNSAGYALVRADAVARAK